MYVAIAMHSRLGLNVVVDVGHHDAYSVPQGILPNVLAYSRASRCCLWAFVAQSRLSWNDGVLPGVPANVYSIECILLFMVINVYYGNVGRFE